MVNEQIQHPPTPQISVVMSVYNGDQFLAEAINSILDQRFQHFELIIVDDASTDASLKIIQAFANRDQRIKIIRNTDNLGLTKSLNKAVNVVQAPYIARQDADDVSLPNRLGEQLEFLNHHSEVALLSGNMTWIDEQGNIIDHTTRHASPEEIQWKLLFYNHVAAHSQVMFRKDAFVNSGGYDETLRYSQDYDLWYRLSIQGKIMIEPTVWVHFRRHAENISTQKASEQDAMSARISKNIITMFAEERHIPADLVPLRQFWLEDFQSLQHPYRIHQMLKALQRDFQVVFGKQYGRAAKAATRRQFWEWAKSISIRRSPNKKIPLLYYWLRWF